MLLNIAVLGTSKNKGLRFQSAVSIGAIKTKKWNNSTVYDQASSLILCLWVAQLTKSHTWEFFYSRHPIDIESWIDHRPSCHRRSVTETTVFRAICDSRSFRVYSIWKFPQRCQRMSFEIIPPQSIFGYHIQTITSYVYVFSELGNIWWWNHSVL